MISMLHFTSYKLQQLKHRYSLSLITWKWRNVSFLVQTHRKDPGFGVVGLWARGLLFRPCRKHNVSNATDEYDSVAWCVTCVSLSVTRLRCVKRLNGSRSCLGWWLFGTQGTLLRMPHLGQAEGKWPSAENSAHCKLYGFPNPFAICRHRHVLHRCYSH